MEIAARADALDPKRSGAAGSEPVSSIPDLRRSHTAAILGVLLVGVGIAVPSAAFLGALGRASTSTPALELGVALFRLGLGVLGCYLVGAGWLPIWCGGRGGARAAWSRWSWPILVLLLLVALGIRLRRLDAGIWYDEINAYVLYMGMSLGEIVTTYQSESQHFLFTVLARVAFAVFGEGAAALRLPAALFGVASVAALYLLARRVGNEREALLSAALLTVSYHHVWFSQNARGYTALLFWTLLSSWLFLRAVDETRSRLWLGYAVAVALGAWSHVTMLFVVLGHAAVFAAWLARRKIGGRAAAAGVVLGFGLTALLTFQLHALVLPQFFSSIGMTARVTEWSDPLWTVLELARGLHIGFTGTVMAAAAFAVFGVGLVSFARTAPVIPVLLVLPAVVSVAVVLAMHHPLWPRFFFFLMGFGVLIAVRGAMVVGTWLAQRIGLPPARTALPGTAIVLGLVLASAATVPAAWQPKQDYVGARGFVEAQRKAGDAVVTLGMAAYPYQAFYRTDWEVVDSVEALNAIRARAARTWVVYTMPLQIQGRYPALLTTIRQDFTVVRKFAGTLNGGTIYVCRADDRSVASPAAIDGGAAGGQAGRR